MRAFFGGLLAVLAAASLALRATWPGATGDVPVLYYVTDPNPLREEQVRGHARWLEENGLPPAEVQLDPANNDVTKMLIQGVSGVGGDLMDAGTGSLLRTFVSAGIAMDITEEAAARGFGSADTWPGIVPQIMVEGRQHSYPANVNADLYLVNLDALEEAGVAPPPRRWTLDEFERAGVAYVQAANNVPGRPRRYFANRVDAMVLRHSMGAATFNETLTRCTLDSEKAVEALALLRRWTLDLRLAPTQLEARQMAAEGAFAGPDFHLFNERRHALLLTGRWAFIYLREYPGLRMAQAEPPHGGFPTCLLNCRGVVAYTGTRHREDALRYLEYLASETYNELVVGSSDALPPNPAFAGTEEFLRPPGHENEWGLHEGFARAALEIGMGPEHSPFVLPTIVENAEAEAIEAMMAGLATPREAAARMAAKVELEIQRRLRQDEALAREHTRRLAEQERVDALLRAGEPVPAALVHNPYLRAWHRAQGRLAE